MKVFCSRCRLVGTGMLNLKPESCSSLQWTCLQYSTSCSRRMKLFWLSWKYVIDGGRTQSVEGSVGTSSNLLSNLLLQANVNRQNGYPSIHTSIHASIFLGPFHEDIIPSAVPLCLLSIFFSECSGFLRKHAHWTDFVWFYRLSPLTVSSRSLSKARMQRATTTSWLTW